MRIKSIINFAGLILLLSSCQMYRSQFDCPPGDGIPCSSVTDIESMIIETPFGSDVVAGGQRGAWKQLVPPLAPGELRKVWIADVELDSGCRISGHYIYIAPNEGR